MTLRNPNKEEETKEEEKEQMRNELKLKAFSDMLKETAKYLMLNHNGYMYDDKRLEYRDKASRKNKEAIRRSGAYTGAVVIVVNAIQPNVYLNVFSEVLGDRGNMNPMNTLDVYCSCLKSYSVNITRSIDILNNKYSFLCGYTPEGRSQEAIFTTCETMKLYIVFWNLFLCALDDDIYNEQLPLVIELAHCFKLDEHIVADICRAVEYVLSGKKLSPDCDLYCETVECAKFFLGHE